MTGPQANRLVRRPTTTTPAGNRTNALTYGFVRASAKLDAPRAVGKWPQAYSASDPSTTVPSRLPVRWPTLL